MKKNAANEVLFFGDRKRNQWLAVIAAAQIISLILAGCFECRPGDVATTNGRAVCASKPEPTSVLTFRSTSLWQHELEPWDRPIVRSPQMSYGLQCPSVGDTDFSWCNEFHCEKFGRCLGGVMQLEP